MVGWQRREKQPAKPLVPAQENSKTACGGVCWGAGGSCCRAGQCGGRGVPPALPLTTDRRRAHAGAYTGMGGSANASDHLRPKVRVSGWRSCLQVCGGKGSLTSGFQRRSALRRDGGRLNPLQQPEQTPPPSSPFRESCGGSCPTPVAWVAF